MISKINIGSVSFGYRRQSKEIQNTTNSNRFDFSSKIMADTVTFTSERKIDENELKRYAPMTALTIKINRLNEQRRFEDALEELQKALKECFEEREINYKNLAYIIRLTSKVYSLMGNPEKAKRMYDWAEGLESKHGKIGGKSNHKL